MADEVKIAEDQSKLKKDSKADSLCPPFQIISKTVTLGDLAFYRGDEEKLRLLLDHANFEALIKIKAIARI